MPDSLYDYDALAWSEEQAGLLRRVAAGERLNDAVDWANVIEEVEAVGLSELRACRSVLRQALIHLLKLHAWPGSRAAAHWQDETRGFLTEAQDRFAPSMRARIELLRLYADALYRVRAATDESGERRPLPDHCPFDLGDLLTEQPDVSALVARIRVD